MDGRSGIRRRPARSRRSERRTLTCRSRGGRGAGTTPTVLVHLGVRARYIYITNRNVRSFGAGVPPPARAGAADGTGGIARLTLDAHLTITAEGPSMNTGKHLALASLIGAFAVGMAQAQPSRDDAGPSRAAPP